MKKHKLLIFTLIVFSFSGVTTISKTAQASAPFWRYGHWVTMTRDVKILKIKNVVPRAYSYSVATYTAPKGSHYKLEHWGTDFSWVLQSGRFNSNSYYTYVVSAKGSNWFKVGTHNTKKYNSFHGYRIEARKNIYTENTNYDKKYHSTLSDYRPTQKSKVIFEYGSHLIPTRHEWDWIHHDYLTEYRYKNGSWHKISTEYVGD